MMNLLDIIWEPPRAPKIIQSTDTVDTIAHVDSVTVQKMDVAPPPTIIDTLTSGDTWVVIVVALALCACIYMAYTYRRSHK